MIELRLASPEACEALGARLAPGVPPGCIVYLRGELGAGKTTLVRGFLRALGHRGTVKSPTYTLVEPYTLGGQSILHLDLYRITDPEEVEFIGLRELLDGRTILLVEWPERGGGALPAADLEVELRYADNGRHCRLQGVSPTGASLLGHLWSQLIGFAPNCNSIMQ